MVDKPTAVDSWEILNHDTTIFRVASIGTLEMVRKSISETKVKRKLML